MSTQTPRGSLSSALIELAKAGNALERLVGLRALTVALEARGASSAEVGELRSLAAKIAPEAERQVRALRVVFEAYGDELDALVSERAADGQQIASGIRDGFSVTGLTRTGVLLDRLAQEDDLTEQRALCAAYDTLVMQEDVKCIAGSDLHCALGAQWFQLSLEDGCG